MAAGIVQKVAGLLGGRKGGDSPSKVRPGTVAPQEGPKVDAGRQSPCPCGCGRDLGPMWENLEYVHPDAVAALRDFMLSYRVEGIVSRRWETRRQKDAHLAYMGIQNGYYNAADYNIHLPYGTDIGLGLAVEDSHSDYETPVYDYVTNYYQAYELAFEALMTAKLPTPKFRPASPQSEVDQTTAKAADDVRLLNERNNPPKKLLRKDAWLRWLDGKVGGYVRWVTDGQRFGFYEITDMETEPAKLSEDSYACPNCGTENPSQTGSPAETGFCKECGAETGPQDFRWGQYAPVPKAVATRKVPRGQVVISLVPGLQFHTPPWAEEQHEFPYLQWNLEVHKARLKAAYPHAAEKITSGGPVLADDAQIRVWRLQVAQGFPAQMPGDALANLVTYSRSWIRPWAFWETEDKKKRELLLALFPDGAFVAFAGEAYCESRPEGMDGHWRVSHALEGDGQNRPGVGDSSLSVNRQINDLSNIEQEAYDYGLPITIMESDLLNRNEVQDSIARPGDIVFTKTRLGPTDNIASKVYQTQPAEVSAAAIQRRQELAGPTLQFLSGIQPAAFGGADRTNETADGRRIAREQAMGRLGVFYRGAEEFYGELHLLGVREYAKNMAADAEIAMAQEGGGFESKYLRLADLQGNVELVEQEDDGFPALPSEVRATIEQILADPMLGPMFMKEPENVQTAMDYMGLREFVAPDGDMVTKTRRIIRELLKGAPIQGGPGREMATVQIDPDLDDPTIAVAVCRRWYQGDEGQAALVENPAGVENVRAFVKECQQIAARQAARTQAKPPSESINYKDLSPAGRTQMAAQAGIRESADEIAQAGAAREVMRHPANAGTIVGAAAQAPR